MSRTRDILAATMSALALVLYLGLGGGTALAAPQATASMATTATKDIEGQTAQNISMSPLGGVYTPVISLSVPAGRWTLSADADVVNFGPSDFTRCRIYVNSTLVSQATAVVGDATLPGAVGIGITVASLGSISAPITQSSPFTATLRCGHDTSTPAGNGPPYVDANASLWAHRGSSTTDIAAQSASSVTLSPVGGTPVTLLSISVPAGSWVLSEDAVGVNFGPSDFVRCQIAIGGTPISGATALLGDRNQAGGQWPGTTVNAIDSMGQYRSATPFTAALVCEHDTSTPSSDSPPYMDPRSALWAHKGGSSVSIERQTTSSVTLSPVGGTPVTLLSISVPAGSWVLSEDAYGVNFGPSDFVRCQIAIGGTPISGATALLGDRNQAGGQWPGATVAGLSSIGTYSSTTSFTAALVCEHDTSTPSSDSPPYMDPRSALWAYQSPALVKVAQ